MWGKAKDEFGEVPADGVTKTVFLMRRRSRQLKRQASLVLALLIACLGGGLTVFVFAEQIQSLQDAQSREIEIAISRHLNAQRDIARDIKDRAAIHSDQVIKFSNSVSSIPTPVDKRFFEEAVRAIDENRKSFLSDISKLLGDHESGQKSFGDFIKEREDRNKNYTQSKMSERDFYSVIMTRAGSLVILFLSVQVLGRLYRQNLALSTDYQAMADALMICDRQELRGQDYEDAVGRMIKILSPTKIDLPDTKVPFEYLGELIRRRKPEEQKPAAAGADEGKAAEPKPSSKPGGRRRSAGPVNGAAPAADAPNAATAPRQPATEGA